MQNHQKMWSVAPRAGAWIETNFIQNITNIIMSPPVRGRGLKHQYRDSIAANSGVAPRAGAWIETLHLEIFLPHISSPPVRGRGLKHDRLDFMHVIDFGRPPCGGVD